MNTLHINFLARFVLTVGLPVLVATGAVDAQAQADGKALYAVRCAACHDSGLLGAPKLGQADHWTARIAQGRAVLLDHSINGFKNMPPRGGNPKLSDQQVGAIVDYMMSRVAPAAAASTAKTPTTAKAAPKAEPKPVPKPVTKRVAATAKKGRGVNQFNRLMKPASKRNLPPTEDGIHDPSTEGTRTLQAPRSAFSTLSKSNFGNRVDWVGALAKNEITPRYDRDDPDVKPVIMDLNIVREVKGSMPNVVYPHKQHTEWLDCSNCHPAIFVPQKGANQLSMANILLGKQCGVCHGKVAFPVGDCRRCHSGKKTASAKKGSGN